MGNERAETYWDNDFISIFIYLGDPWVIIKMFMIVIFFAPPTFAFCFPCLIIWIHVYIGMVYIVQWTFMWANQCSKLNFDIIFNLPHCIITSANSELRAYLIIWIKDWIFSYHLLQRKPNFITSPQLYAALNSYTSLMVGRGEESLFSGILSACVAYVYSCVVRCSPKIFWITCAININSVGCAAHNTVVNTGNTGRMNAAEQTHLTSSNHYWGITIESCIELWGCNEIQFSLQEVIGK